MDRGVLPTGELPALVKDRRRAARRRLRPLRFTIKALLLIVVAVFLLPPVLTGFRQAADTIGTRQPGADRRRVRPPAPRARLLLVPHPGIARHGRGRAVARPDLPHPAEHQGAVEHRPRRQRGRIGARLPAADAVGCQRPGRRVRARHRRHRLGRRAEHHLLARARRLDPDPRRQPALRNRRRPRRDHHGHRGDARDRADRRAGAGRAGGALDRPQVAASTRTSSPPCCARSASGWRSWSATGSLLRKVVFWATLNWLFDAASLWMFLRAFGGDAQRRRC